MSMSKPRKPLIQLQLCSVCAWGKKVGDKRVCPYGKCVFEKEQDYIDDDGNKYIVYVDKIINRRVMIKREVKAKENTSS